ncbi:hypothetical protein GRX01_09485 [Halobaculum sp. WSA2]|uniref:Big-1 domain-containing protein n=1 Tax=Halobaculum saliterrae TaxID=2073113 RepID=A0A6B0SRK7_9EURY|nr:hypothetical protein [Halobaculum saliterrae]MXR41568.1 hypothetical protein [Halobaculum saliterrae]
MTGRGDGNRDRDRAVTVQIGAVILFGFLIVALSTYQATVVPDQNREVEFLHSQEVQTDMVELSSSVAATGRTGDSAPATVKLGTRYPSRAFFVNPPPASGSLRSVEPSGDGNVTLENLSVMSSANGEAADYWDVPSNRNKSTRFVVYEPGYNVYRGGPATRYESGVTFNRFDGGANLTLIDQGVVEGDRVTLIAVSGDLDRSGVSTASVEPEAVSTVSRRERVSGELDVTVPTTLNATRWEELLADEIDDGWVNGTRQTGQGRVTIELNDSRTYSLGIAAVHLGSGGAPDRTPAYLDVERSPSEMTVDTTREVVVEVRDEYGNPVPGTAVAGYAPEGSFADGTTATVRTDDDGRAVFEYTAGGDDATLNFSFATEPDDPAFDGSAPENVSVNVSTTAGTGGGGGGGLTLVGDATAFDGEDGNDVPGGVSLTVRNTRATEITIVGATVMPEDSRYNGLSDAATGEGRGRSELFVSADGTAGYTDVQTTGAQYTYVTGRGRSLSLVESREERAYDTNSQSFVDVSTVVAPGGAVSVPSGADATVEFAEIYDLGTDTATAVNMSNKDVRVLVSYTTGDGKRTDEFVVTPEPPGTGDAGGNSAPTVSITDIQVSESGGSGNVQSVDVSFVPDDPDGNLDTATVTVRVGGTQTDARTVDVSGQEGTTVTVSDLDGANENGQVEVSVTVTDADGATGSDTKTEDEA